MAGAALGVISGGQVLCYLFFRVLRTRISVTQLIKMSLTLGLTLGFTLGLTLGFSLGITSGHTLSPTLSPTLGLTLGFRRQNDAG